MDYALMNQYLYEGKAKEVGEMTSAALAEGRSVKEVLEEGLIAGMSVVGEDFKHNILYVPEVLICARAMKAGMLVLKPLLSAKGNTDSTGRLLMGTVRGDLHDIGKNLVCMMAEGAGFEVKDIGVDQSVEKFAAAAETFKPDIIGMSALLTTTMTYMKVVIDGFKVMPGQDHIKMTIGGAPISQMFADEIGADGYGADASSAVDLFLYLVGKGAAPVATQRRGVVVPVAAPVAAVVERAPGSKSRFQILYWKHLPMQIKAWDDYEEIKLDLPGRFADAIDLEAQKLGLAKGDDYISQMRWGDEGERVGLPGAIAAAVRAEIEAATP